VPFTLRQTGRHEAAIPTRDAPSVPTPHPAEPPLVVSVHDAAPATAAETSRWLSDLAALGVPASVLAVPGPWRGPALADAPDFAAELRRAAAAGHELVLHGWTHTAQPDGGRSRRWSGQVAARGAGEFWSLDEAAARERIEQGLGVLRAAGIEPRGFVPPGYLASPGAQAALKASGLRYWTSHFAVHDLHAEHSHRVVALSHRPATGADGRPLPERSGAFLIARSPQWFTGHGRPLRLALHPDDLHRAGLRDTTLRAIEGALARGARAVTYVQLLALYSDAKQAAQARAAAETPSAVLPAAAAR
jgi:predicted deacetylase